MEKKYRFPEIILQLMDENNLNPNKLAIKLKTTPTIIYYWLDDFSKPTTKYLIKLAEIFNVSLDFLIYGEDEKQHIKNINKQIEFEKRRTRNETIEHCKEMIKEYFVNYVDKIPDNSEMNYVKATITTPCTEITALLESIKS